MTKIKEFNTYGEELENRLKLRTYPVAVKMLKRGDDIPEDAFRPKRDKGIHLAQCQAFAMSRRDGMTVAMLKEDHWCFAPLIAYGFVDRPDEAELQRFLDFPRFERDKYVGMLTAPLKKAAYEPDLVLVYCDAAQLRSLLFPLHHYGEAPAIHSQFFPPSCAHAIVSVFTKNQFVVVLPDIGEDMRTICSNDEIVISIPGAKLEQIVKGLRAPLFEGADFIESPMLKMADFKRPAFYQELFKKWGLDSEK